MYLINSSFARRLEETKRKKYFIHIYNLVPRAFPLKVGGAPLPSSREKPWERGWHVYTYIHYPWDISESLQNFRTKNGQTHSNENLRRQMFNNPSNSHASDQSRVQFRFLLFSSFRLLAYRSCFPVIIELVVFLYHFSTQHADYNLLFEKNEQPSHLFSCIPCPVCIFWTPTERFHSRGQQPG